MRGPIGPTIVKLGGSHAFSPHLKNWLDAIAGCAGCAVVVPGGGPFADAVRMAQPRMGFDDRAAHEMAVLAMEQYGCALTNLGDSFETRSIGHGDPECVTCRRRAGLVTGGHGARCKGHSVVLGCDK